MSHFNFDQMLSEAVELDSTINLNNSVSRMSLKPLSTGSVLNRSRSASRLSPTLLSSKPNKKSPARSKTPTRLGFPEVYNKKCSTGGDRFIPNRSTTDFEYASHSFVSAAEDDAENTSLAQQERRRLLEESLNLSKTQDSRILSFKSKVPAAKDGHANNMKILYSAGKPQVQKSANIRQIPSLAEKILDAPEMMDDFYLHLLDWSSLNHVAVGLTAGMYIWNATDGNILQLFQKEDNQYISSVKWIKEGNVLGVGDSEGCVELWDVGQTKKIRTMRGHSGRITCMDWNQHILVCGDREGSIMMHDVRVANHLVSTLSGHSQEVCGLTWNTEGKMLASGGNDNTVHLWDIAQQRPVNSITEHQSAVKAVSWCPWQRGVLATGGGTVDRTIRIWNIASMSQIHHIDTGSQVSSLVWNSDYKELVSGHGFSQNQLTVWKFPSLSKVSDLTGHTSRVLLLVCSPDGTTVASVAADETIRLWKVWPQQQKLKKKSEKSSHPVSKLAQSIR